MANQASSSTLKLILMADSCFTALPVHFASQNSSHHHFPQISKSNGLFHLPCPSPSLLSPHLSLSLLGKERFPSFLPLIARTSGWVGEGSTGWKAEDEFGPPGGREMAAGARGFPEGDGGEPYPVLLEEAKLFVSNLPYDVDSEKLALLFQKAGIVQVSEVIYKRETEQSRGFGFVTMSTVEEAEQAVQLLHRYDWNGRLLTVNRASPRGSRPESPVNAEPSFRIYVGNLPWQVDDAGLEQIFSEHGKVLSTRVVYDRETGRSRGFGFVAMASKAELDEAIAALDGQSLDGRALRVNVAEERPQRGSSF